MVHGTGRADSTGPAPEQAAVVAARASGKPVEVTALTSETRQVVANPNGRLTATFNAQPARVRRAGTWVPVDTTLRVNPDGTVSAAATPEDLTLSGGGDGPLARYRRGGKSVEVSWPGPLPKPVLTGSTAVYQEVRPGIDLRVTATPQGLSQTLTVKTREAAADGKLDELPVKVDRKQLAAKDTAFPVTLAANGPSLDAPKSGWAEVADMGLAGNSYWGGDGDPVAKVGYSAWDRPIVRYRSYFLFDIGALRGKHVLNAQFNARENYAPSCSPRVVDLYHTGPIGPGLTWNTQPWATYIGGQNVAFGYSGCPANVIGWTVTGNVESALGSGSAGVAFMLRAGDENDSLAWKKFDTNPSLIVDYNSYPDEPFDLSSEGRPCADGQYVYTAAPRLKATATDPDGGPVAVTFEWWKGDSRIGGSTTLDQGSGAEFAVTVPGGAYRNGNKIRWRAQTTDHTDSGDWTDWCELTVDQTAPDKPPTVASDMYPENDLGGGVGRTGTFSFGANGVGDVVRYRYWTASVAGTTPPAFVSADAPGGPAKALVTPPSRGPMDLYVQSVDRAGNVGQNIRHYHFAAGRGTPSTGHWQLDGFGHQSTVSDASGNGRTGTVTNDGAHLKGAAWTTGRNGDALRFDGESGDMSAGGPAVRTDQSFAVAAWVRLDRADDDWYAAVSQDGSQVSGFFLQYGGGTRKWEFTMAQTDGDDPTFDRVTADAPVRPGVWTHLAGSYDAADGRMRIYVNGELGGTLQHTGTWNAAGPLAVGRGKFGGQPDDRWPGAVDDVRVYDRILGEDEVRELATTPSLDEGLWPLDETAGVTAADVSGNFRTATATGGVTWGPGNSGGAARLNGTTGYLSTAGPVVRTDGSYTAMAWVLMDDPGTSDRTVLSQDGTGQASGFAIKYRASSGKWSVTVPDENGNGTTGTNAESADVATRGEWTHLAAVRDVASGRLRLYVNGAQVTSLPLEGGWQAGGPFAIGRSRIQGRPAEFWAGAIDDVRVYSGVRTDDQIKAAFRDSATRPSSPYAGQISRWYSHDGDHLTGTASVPPGYHFDGSYGLPAPEGAADTRVLYSCLYQEKDQFTSMDPNCEGHRKLGEHGRVYLNPPKDVPTIALYRCAVTKTLENFDSSDPTCGGETVKGPLGFTRAYGALVRSARPGDRVSSAFGVPGDYRPEAVLGMVALATLPDTVALRTCRDGADEFVSTQSDCEGAAVATAWIGNLWTQPPPGVDSTRLYRCKVTASGERFESLDPGCEGQAQVKPLGYVATGLGGWS
ncbi:LamG-like jellyroll fold domain-containing protein [Nonomuraea helvata]|uniref:LamG-like jellyroll fold domain-containing protein n=1 Tax=Nonomuraea helvata TaxID=37484 RepID=A0ABV5SA74_9ACTN